jgi:ribonuclease BN (tRNA processing enzyme)
MQFTFLGTGAGLGNTTEYNSCMVVDNRLLLDAGLSVPQNLLKAGGDADLLDAVLLSHFDPDHTLGFPLLAMRRSDDKPLPVIGPAGTADFVLNLCDAVGKSHYEEKLDFIEIEATENEDARTTMGDYAITALYTEHEPESQGYLITDSSGFTLFYSGDSAACSGLERGVSMADAAAIEMTELTGRHDRHLSLEHDLPPLLQKMKPGGQLFLIHRAYPRQEYLNRLRGIITTGRVDRVVLPEDLQSFELHL